MAVMLLMDTSQESDFIIKEKKADYDILVQDFLALIEEILGTQYDVKNTLDLLRGLSEKREEYSTRVTDIIESNGYTIDSVLERYYVVLRKKLEKQKIRDDEILESRAKQANKSLGELKEFYFNQLGKYSRSVTVKYSDGSINYIESMKNVNKEDKRLAIVEESREEVNNTRIEQRNIRRFELTYGDYPDLEDAVDKALQLGRKLTKRDGIDNIPNFLAREFPGMPKMVSEKAISYFEERYFTKLENKRKKIVEKDVLYPNDRKITEIDITFSIKEIFLCNVRGEKEIIDMVLRELRQFINPRLFINIDDNFREEFKLLIQGYIDRYYEILKKVEVFTYNEYGNRRWLPLDLEKTGLRVAKNGKIEELDEKGIQEKLDAKNNILKRNLARNNPRSKIEPTFAKFNGFENIIKLCIEQVLALGNLNNFIENKVEQPIKQSRFMIIDLLRKFGFNYVKPEMNPDVRFINFRMKKD